MSRFICLLLPIFTFSACGPLDAVRDSETASTRARPATATHTINGTDINVRNERLQVIGSAKHGEKVAVTGREKEGLGHVFVEVYFFEAPQGFGWVARQYLSQISSGETVSNKGIVWDPSSLALSGGGCHRDDVSTIESGSSLSFLFDALRLDLTEEQSAQADCQLKIFATVPREAYGALATLRSISGLVKTRGAEASLTVSGRWIFRTPQGMIEIPLPKITRTEGFDEMVNESGWERNVEAKTADALRRLCSLSEVGGVLELDASISGETYDAGHLSLSLDGLDLQWLNQPQVCR